MADKFLQSLNFGDGNKRYPLPLIQQPYTQRAEHSVGHVWENVYDGGVNDMVFDPDHTGVLFFAPESGGVYGYNLNNFCESVGLSTELIVNRLVIAGTDLIASTTSDGIWAMSLGSVGTWNYVGTTEGGEIDLMEYDPLNGTIYFTITNKPGLLYIHDLSDMGIVSNSDELYFSKIAISENDNYNLAIIQSDYNYLFLIDKDPSDRSVYSSGTKFDDSELPACTINFIKYFSNNRFFVIGTEYRLYIFDCQNTRLFEVGDDEWEGTYSAKSIPRNFKDIYWIPQQAIYVVTCGSYGSSGNNGAYHLLSINSFGQISGIVDYDDYVTSSDSNESMGIIEFIDGNIILPFYNSLLSIYGLGTNNIDIYQSESPTGNPILGISKYAKYEDDILFAIETTPTPSVLISKYQNETVPCPQEGKVLKVVDGKWTWGSLT